MRPLAPVNSPARCHGATSDASGRTLNDPGEARRQIAVRTPTSEQVAVSRREVESAVENELCPTNPVSPLCGARANTANHPQWSMASRHERRARAAEAHAAGQATRRWVAVRRA